MGAERPEHSVVWLWPVFCLALDPPGTPSPQPVPCPPFPSMSSLKASGMFLGGAWRLECPSFHLHQRKGQESIPGLEFEMQNMVLSPVISTKGTFYWGGGQPTKNMRLGKVGLLTARF